jgi:hypothetical protein
MKQSEAVEFLYRDLQIVTSHLISKNYDQIFEEEMQEYFPFNENIMVWLRELYTSEKYSFLDKNKLSLYYEKEHPFLFVRDLAHMNAWNLGFERKERRDHIAGLMFSSQSTYSLEATFCLCRPSQILKEVSTWFDFKQAMTNLEKVDPAHWHEQAWKACSLFYLYFHLSEESETIKTSEIEELIEPYRNTIEIALIEGNENLKSECLMMKKALGAKSTQALIDELRICL